MGGGFINFKSFSKQIPAPFKIYADFECILKETKKLEDKIVDRNSSYTKKYQDHIPCGLVIKLFVLMINLVKVL